MDYNQRMIQICGTREKAWEQPDWYRGAPSGDQAKHLGIPPLYAAAEIQDFEAGEVRTWDTTVNNYVPFGNYLSRLVLNGPRDIIILGPNGSGKSYLASALAKSWAMAWTNMTELVLQIRATFSPGNEKTERGVLIKWAERPGLVLDDLTALHKTDYALSTALFLVSTRVEHKRPTIVTTFSSLQEIDKMESSLASRLGGFLVLKTEYAGNKSGDRRLGDA